MSNVTIQIKYGFADRLLHVTGNDQMQVLIDLPEGSKWQGASNDFTIDPSLLDEDFILNIEVKEHV